ncbi:hypothetical protein ACFQMF_15655 [Halorubrum rutilum]|uniref:Uncharacterized protein n=1 Tax=Halorubrum rutilum TaxID=1364933 RepID=A0ABD6ANV4_9EURY
MVGVSRSFNAIEYHENIPPSEFGEAEPIARRSTTVEANKSKNSLLVASHQYPWDDESVLNRTWVFDITFENWADVSELLSTLRDYRDLPQDVSLTKDISAEQVEVSETVIHQGDEPDVERDVEIFEGVTISIRISDSEISFAKVPEGGIVIFPNIPVGDAYSLEGGSLNTVNLDRFIELLEKSEQGFTSQNNISPTLSPEDQQKLDEYKYGGEVIGHAQDGDICLEKGLQHLALSSYIHAIEWSSIAYLQVEGKDIIEEEKDGNYYNFAGGRNSILDEVKERSELDQKTISQLKSMNRAERRWMAHHKSGEVLPEEVEAVRARLSKIPDSLLLRSA